MAFDEYLAHRVRAALADAGVDPVEQPMFGGLAFMVRGHMTVGIVRHELMVRVGKDGHDDAVGQPHARQMDLTGRAMTGMVYVDAEGVRDDVDLAAWVERGLAHTRSMQPK